MKFIFSFLVLLHYFLVQFSFALSINQNCKTQKGKHGKCLPENKCSYEFDDDEPTFTSCNRDDLVCCPIQEREKDKTVRISSEVVITDNTSSEKKEGWRFFKQYNLMFPEDEKPWKEFKLNFPTWQSRKPVTTTTTKPTLSSHNKRISEIKCEEYSKSVTNTRSALPLLTHTLPVLFKTQNCKEVGLRLIVGGEKTVAGEFPHMAAIGFGSKNNIHWKCGGTLISDNFVLTAAHCTASSLGKATFVRLGALNLTSSNGVKPVDYEIKKIILHPGFRWPAKYNDIALLQLKSKVQFTRNIRPACLYNKDIFGTENFIATGWGHTEYGGDQSDTLLKVSLNLIGSSVCNRLYRLETKTNKLPKGIISSMLCAGDLNGGKDTCQGDSGGPIEIMNRNNKCIHHIVGITSFGKICAARNSPGVYTKVSHYIPWIEDIVWPLK